LNRPATSLIASIALHSVAVAAILLASLLGWSRAPLPVVTAVPVSIVSDITIEAAAADNPSEELVTEDADTAPVESSPEPTPPEPEPQPTPAPRPPAPTPPAPRPTPTPTPRPTPPPTPARPAPQPTPPRATPPRANPPAATPPRANPPARPATPPRREDSLDLDALSGPARNATAPGNRPRTGQQGSGAAPRAVGRASLQALASQIYDNWDVPCTLPGGDDLTIGVKVTLTERGTIVGSPRITGGGSGNTWRIASEGVQRALRATHFRMPDDYEQQELTFSFQTANYCRNR